MAGAQVFERGRDYCHSGMVHDLVMRGDTLYAEVEGSQYEPYQVTVEFAQNEMAQYGLQGAIPQIAVATSGVSAPMAVSSLQPVLSRITTE